ncbi:mannitol dehydrogenase family protein [Pseudolysinimonas kribbensis]|uniref:mannitol dehydrogenase family protein n=1 Tax=Pseudolysinimonas kribbensis TaxID=433641 RepID=UPI0031CE6BB1
MHVGLGSFHRAHQAWYTHEADPAGEWGIAAFTGRGPRQATVLAEQDGLYTLLERSAAGDRATVVRSIVEAADGADLARFIELVAAPATALITITITEAGYRLRADGAPDLEDPGVAADLATLAAQTEAELPPVTALGRILAGLRARRRAGSGPLAIVPCDNMPGNGALVRNALVALADRVDPRLAAWILASVAVVSTSVDRIAPAPTDDDREIASRLIGLRDEATVVAEPFRDWVLSGDFPVGRPAWERAGARFVDDIEPFELRKLRLLNGAHSLLAYGGLLRGHETVPDAIADEVLARRVAAAWDEAERHLPRADELELDRYRAALLERFSNRRLGDRLVRIAADGSTKLRLRIVPTLVAERAAGRPGAASMAAIAAWVALQQRGVELPDAALPRIEDRSTAGLLRLIDPRLADDAGLRHEIQRAVDDAAAGAGG